MQFCSEHSHTASRLGPAHCFFVKEKACLPHGTESCHDVAVGSQHCRHCHCLLRRKVEGGKEVPWRPLLLVLEGAISLGRRGQIWQRHQECCGAEWSNWKECSRHAAIMPTLEPAAASRKGDGVDGAARRSVLTDRIGFRWRSTM